VPGAVRETQLVCQYIPVHKSMEKRNVWIYNCQ
jgi:hypothetical protein